MHVENIFFIDIWFVKQDIKKWLKTKICSFLWLIWKWKEKGTKKLTFPDGDLNPGFLNKFPPKIWIFMEIRSIELGVLRTSGLYYKRPRLAWSYDILLHWRVNLDIPKKTFNFHLSKIQDMSKLLINYFNNSLWIIWSYEL